MECVSQKCEIKGVLAEVSNVSFREKTTELSEESVNRFLDAIIDFKKNLTEKSDKLFDITESIEKLTWFNNLDDEELKLLNDLISSARDLHSTLIRKYIKLDPIRTKGIAKKEIKRFKLAIDDFKDVFTDLESVFFFLPNMPEFVEITKQLSAIK
jgi:hypothetical protein